MTAFRVLGPVEAVTDRGPVALGPRQRAVLARLLVARGRVVPVERLVDDLWEEPPDGAVGAIRTFVSDLRRALEPGRAPRQPARLLVTAPPGYALRPAPDAVDAWRFEAAVDAAPGPDELDAALALWRGPAYAEFAAAHWARAEIDRLDELRRRAVERRAEALLALGRAADAVADLSAHAAEHPLREEAWRLLATALYRSGRQGEALAALRRARATLVAELGADPGPALRQLEADILAHAPRLDPAPATAGRLLLGRDTELARLEAAAATVARTGRPALALVSGEAGAGKTALAEALRSRLDWETLWGRAPEHEGAPVEWPWTDGSPPGADPATARFHRHRAAASRLAAATARGPALVVADDVHRADEDALDLLVALLDEPLPALVVATYRATEIGPVLTAALARFARAEPVRVYLAGLPEAATGELAAAVAGADLDAGTRRAVHLRTGGNPFFVREVGRLLGAEGAAALDGVPAGVRDVIRHRLSRLPAPAQTVLRRAAVLGRDVDADVLAEVAGGDVVDALDAALRTGFLTEEGALRFTHVLVRDTLYEDLSRVRRGRWHADTALALERLRPDDVTALAHHFGHATGPGTAAKAARYAAAAAALAERRALPREAARWWRAASTVDDERARLAALMGLGRALAVTGDLAGARRLRAEAAAEAMKLDDPLLAADVLTAFDVPAIWPRNDDEELSARIVDAAEEVLAHLPAGRPALRSRLLSTLALELRGTTGDRGDRAAREAEALARAAGDPALLAFALNARFMHSFGRAGLAPARERLGAELVALASADGLVTVEVLGHLIRLQAHCALGDLPAADADARAADDLAARYDLPLVGVFTRWYAGLRLAVAGRLDEAEAAYRRADASLADAGMPGMAAGLLGLALFAIGRPAGDLGPYEPWVRPVTLLAAGRRAEAAAALAAQPPPPHDLLLEARLVLRARAARELDDTATLRTTLDALRPAAAEWAGAGSGVLTLGPVADVLTR